MLTAVGELSEFERELIRARTGEARVCAVANGVRLGRKPRVTRHQQQEAIKRLNAGKETSGEIARSYNVIRRPISRLIPKARRSFKYPNSGTS
jgi:DNA invertase Pin-like site-specific DNA recombinase